MTIEPVSGALAFDSPDAYVRCIRDIARDIVRLLQGQHRADMAKLQLKLGHIRVHRLPNLNLNAKKSK